MVFGVGKTPQVETLEEDDNDDQFEKSIQPIGGKKYKDITDFMLCKIPGKLFLGSGAFGKVYLA